MNPILENGAALTVILCALLMIGVGLYQFIHMGRFMAICYSGLARMLRSCDELDVTLQQVQRTGRYEAARRHTHHYLGTLVQDRIVMHHHDMMELINDLFYRMDGDREEFRPYFHDLMDHVSRGGRISCLLSVCLNSTMGLYGILRVHCVAAMKHDFKHLSLYSNQEDRRLPHELEDDLAVIYVLLFIYFAFDRTPDSIHMSLQFGENSVSFTVSDDDAEAPGGLTLSQSEPGQWPAALHHASSFASLHKGFATADATYTEGLSFTVCVPYYADRLLSE
ncbi:hypothetical protein AB9P05_24000 [Roseivirga sp. BDSF3-8]|uniref:hypothetical protein n=1 Tax=Roseivirga sp. BDSF3-8 TaxID=3241598 RepID=UPI003532625E